MENNKTPSIRFKGFTDPWEQRKLGDIVGIYDGVHQTPNYQNSGVMFLSVENIATLKSSKFISEEDFKRNYKIFPQENDILMTRIGDVGTTNVVTDNSLKAYYVSLALLKYKSTDPYFLSNAIQSDYVQKGLANRTLKTAIPMKINKDEIGKVSVMLPLSATEQQQIGTYFRNLDNLITLHQRKYNKLLNVKKSMLEKMFPKNGSNIPEIRFKGFTDPWEQRKLGDLGSLKNGMNFSKDAMGHGYAFVNLQNIFGNNVVDVKSLGLAEASEKQLLEYSLQKGDVLFVRSSVKLEGVGEAALVAETLENTTYSGFIIRFRDEYGLNNDFKKFVFVTKKVRDQIMSQATNSANKNISQSVLENLTFEIPSKDEQKQIGEYFSSLDNLITLHQRELEKLQNIKKSMLEKMFV